MKPFGRLIALCVVLAAVAQAQTPAKSFDVASVKPSNPNPPTPQAAVPMILPALGRLTAQNVTLRMLVMTAYQKQPFQIVGGPSWQNSTKFDINARAEDASLTTDGLLQLLQGLLADRFALEVHTETREVPIYALVLARGDGRLGAKLTPSTDDCPDFKVQQQQQLEALAKGGVQALAAMRPKPGEAAPPCSVSPLPAQPPTMAMRMRGQSMPLLTLLLTQFTGRPVVDQTGLTGLYDFDFEFNLQELAHLYAELGVSMPMPPNLPEGRSVMTMLQEDLGLKLDSQRGPGEVLVIDSAEMPTPD
jgi:uncharacterized protein (TIGR03435 family)